MENPNDVDTKRQSNREVVTDKRLVIGIGHKARQGKDTAALHVQRIFGCKIIHFADALYDECRHATIIYKKNPPELYCKAHEKEFFRWSAPDETVINWITANGIPRPDLPFGAELYFGGMKEKDATLLQFWGTEFRRKKFSWDYWVNIIRAKIEAHPADDFIIPDTRFKNEAKMIKDLGGQVWKIDRAGYRSEDRNPNHSSEIDLNEWEFDAVFLNDGTIQDLQKKVELNYRKLKGFMNG